MTPNDSTKSAALHMLAKGEATLAEVAQLAQTSRQLVRYWAKRTGIDPGKARDAFLARAWKRATKK